MSERLTVERYAYAPHIRAADKLLGAARALGAPIGRLELEGILSDARKRTGLDDWGDDAFLEPMKMLVENVDQLGLTHIARTVVRETYVKAVANRTRLEDYLRRHPQVLDTPIRKPVFVLGFPRSGTTILQNMLAEAPNRRGLQFWELITPVPVHEDPVIDRQRRLATAARILRASYIMAPEMRSMHAVAADTHEECWYLFFTSFAVLNLDFQTGMRSYGDWLLQHDMRGPYREYRRWLQMMLTLDPAEHVLLKCPEHLWFIDELLEVFPDACIVWTHRDPVASIGSYCSMMTLTRRMLYGDVDLHGLGRDITDRFEQGISRAMEARKRHDPARFYDVDFVDLVKNPKRVVQQVTEYFGLDNPPDYDQRLDTYLGQTRGDERGKHIYSARRYGIDTAEVHRRYADYIDAFSIPTKADHG